MGGAVGGEVLLFICVCIWSDVETHQGAGTPNKTADWPAMCQCTSHAWPALLSRWGLAIFSHLLLLPSPSESLAIPQGHLSPRALLWSSGELSGVRRNAAGTLPLLLSDSSLLAKLSAIIGASATLACDASELRGEAA